MEKRRGIGFHNGAWLTRPECQQCSVSGPSGIASGRVIWEPHFQRHSYGFRPQRLAHQAVRELQANIHQGHGWVVDIDLEAFFDRVNHDR